MAGLFNDVPTIIGTNEQEIDFAPAAHLENYTIPEFQDYIRKRYANHHLRSIARLSPDDTYAVCGVRCVSLYVCGVCRCVRVRLHVCVRVRVR
jgi:hypothetical protein